VACGGRDEGAAVLRSSAACWAVPGAGPAGCRRGGLRRPRAPSGRSQVPGATCAGGGSYAYAGTDLRGGGRLVLPERARTPDDVPAPRARPRPPCGAEHRHRACCRDPRAPVIRLTVAAVAVRTVARRPGPRRRVRLRGLGASLPGDGNYPCEVAAAAEWARDHGSRQIVLMGASMGGTAVMVTAAHLGGAIAGVIDLSGPADFPGMNALDADRRIHVPALFGGLGQAHRRRPQPGSRGGPRPLAGARVLTGQGLYLRRRNHAVIHGKEKVYGSIP
jgi:pimeloyl-ACP methyl ester carboxylesterase